MTERAPFIPPSPDASPLTASPKTLLRNRPFLRLWSAQLVASLGDWVGIIAILAMAARVSEGGTGVGLVMAARLLPGFLFAPLGGALVDRWDRKRVLVVCNIGRAALLAALPFFPTLWGLILISFGLEVMALMWGPAKEASVPHLVRSHELAPANSLSLVASYGTFPVSGIVFAALAGIAAWLAGFTGLSFLDVNRESLAIWSNAVAFLGSALLLSGLDVGRDGSVARGSVDVTRTFREIVEGLRYIATHGIVRAVMLGLAGGLVGGGAIIPLGPVFAIEVLGGGSATFGVLMTALGIGAGIGVVTLVALQRRLPRPFVFFAAIIGTGAGIVAAGSLSALTPVVLLVAFVGACAGSGYVTGFTLLHENVVDELRGRTFATLYTVVRLCLLLSLAAGPFVAAVLGRLSTRYLDGEVAIGAGTLALPGVRLALWLGGAITLASGILARHLMRRAERIERTERVGTVDDPSGAGVERVHETDPEEGR